MTPITTADFELIQRIANVYAETDYYKGVTKAKLITMMLRAHGLGLPVSEAPELFSELHGRLTLSANAMATLMKRAGYNWLVRELNDDTAHITVFDASGNELGDSIFTIQDAQQAGIVGKNKNWKDYPRNMLMARAISNAAKWYAPDAFGGAALYTPEELGDIQTPPMDLDETADATPAPLEVPFVLDGIGNIKDDTRKKLWVLLNRYAKAAYGVDRITDARRLEFAQECFETDKFTTYTSLNDSGGQFLINELEAAIAELEAQHD